MNYFNRANAWFFGFLFFFLPLFLFLFPGGLFPATRLLILFLLTVVVFGFWAVKNFLNKSLFFVKGGYNLPLFGLFVLVVVSLLLLPSPGAMNDAFFGTAGLFLVFILLTFGLVNLGNRLSLKNADYGFFGAIGVLVLLSLFSYLSIANKIIPTSVFSEKSFISGENAFYLGVYFLVVAAYGVFKLLNKHSKMLGIFGFVSSLLGLGVLFVNFLKTGMTVTFLPFSSGWAITVELFKNFKNLILGIGFNQFGIYSSLLRTPELNQDKYIFMRFPQTSNAVIELMLSLGILGLFVLGFLIYKVGKSAVFQIKTKGMKSDLLPIVAAIGVLTASFLFLPFSAVSLFLFFILLSMLAINLKTEGNGEYEEAKIKIIREGEGFLSFQTGAMMEKYQSAPKIFAGMVGVLAILIFYFFLAYPMLAEIHFAKYLQALAQNKGRTAYEEMNAAASANLKNDYYLGELSRVNFQLALSLNAKKNTDAQDRDNIAVLINQAIAAARGATSLNSGKLANWENLAYLYQQLITTDVNAANLAAQAYVQAVNLNPQDPTLRVKFAQMLYLAKAYKDAVSQLNVALSMKSDFANAYYNLGLNYKALGDLENAKKSLETAQKFVTKGSKDETVLQTEIDNLDKVENVDATKTAEVKIAPAADKKLTTPGETPELENLRKDLLQIVPATGSGEKK
jgi:tetratricopeptide (TPR) repeat protein